MVSEIDMEYYYRRGNKYFFRNKNNKLNFESSEFDRSILKKGQIYEMYFSSNENEKGNKL